MKEVKSYYDILDIPKSADALEIRRAYRRMMLKTHPDVDSDPSAHEKARLLNSAYETLSDPVLRAAYDSILAMSESNSQTTDLTHRAVIINDKGERFIDRWNKTELRRMLITVPMMVIFLGSLIALIGWSYRDILEQARPAPRERSFLATIPLKMPPSFLEASFIEKYQQSKPLFKEYSLVLLKARRMKPLQSAKYLAQREDLSKQVHQKVKELAKDCDICLRAFTGNRNKMMQWLPVMDYFKGMEKRLENHLTLIATLKNEQLPEKELESIAKKAMKTDLDWMYNIQSISFYASSYVDPRN